MIIIEKNYETLSRLQILKPNVQNEVVRRILKMHEECYEMIFIFMKMTERIGRTILSKD